jgi:hypothetical protein
MVSNWYQLVTVDSRPRRRQRNARRRFPEQRYERSHPPLSSNAAALSARASPRPSSFRCAFSRPITAATEICQPPRPLPQPRLGAASTGISTPTTTSSRGSARPTTPTTAASPPTSATASSSGSASSTTYTPTPTSTENTRRRPGATGTAPRATPSTASSTGPYRLKAPHRPPRLETLGRRRLPHPHPGGQGEVQVRHARHRQIRPHLVGRRLRLHRRATKAIATRYSGEAGAKLLESQGYPREMIEDMGGAGTRTIKMRGGMGLLGVLGKYGMYRLCNSLALLDVQRARGQAGGRQGRPNLVELHLARRSGTRPSLGAWLAELRDGLQRPPEFQADHHERQEPRGEQDGRRPLVRRSHGARLQDRGDRPGIRRAVDQGRLLDSRPPIHRRRAVARA